MKRKSDTGMLRDALQLLRRHPRLLSPALAAFASAGPVPYWRDGGYSAWLARNEALLLKTLNSPEEVVVDYMRVRRLKTDGKPWKSVAYETGTRHLHETINNRAALKAQIDKHSHNGRVKVVESGRDCDCVRYDGVVRECDANVMAYLRMYDETAQWADGPFSFEIVPWDSEVEYRSRDLALEAYEDGHPHHVIDPGYV